MAFKKKDYNKYKKPSAVAKLVEKDLNKAENLVQSFREVWQTDDENEFKGLRDVIALFEAAIKIQKMKDMRRLFNPEPGAEQVMWEEMNG